LAQVFLWLLFNQATAMQLIKQIAIVPVPKPRMTRADKWRRRECCDRYWKYKDELRLAWGNDEVPDSFHVIFIIPMPKNWSKKKRVMMYGKPHQNRPDASNLLKAFEDALMKEDSVLWDIRATKIWGEKGSIEVRSLELFMY
jgi:Holliday junction resolvase RusA-like endonuclease